LKIFVKSKTWEIVQKAHKSKIFWKILNSNFFSKISKNFSFLCVSCNLQLLLIFLKFWKILKILIFSKIFEKSKNVGNRPKSAENHNFLKNSVLKFFSKISKNFSILCVSCHLQPLLIFLKFGKIWKISIFSKIFGKSKNGKSSKKLG
jgi:hypothetical protein